MIYLVTVQKAVVDVFRGVCVRETDLEGFLPWGQVIYLREEGEGGGRKLWPLVKLYPRISIWNSDQNLIRAFLNMAVCIVLFYGFKEKIEPTRKEVFQDVQHEIFELLKLFQNNIKVTRAAYSFNSEISNIGNNITLMIFLCCH